MRKGFTLIEVLIVIAIIGILSSVVLVKLTGGKEKAQWSKYVSYVSQVTKMTKAAMAMGYFSSITTGQGCLGDYHSGGSQCWGGEASWELDNASINAALSNIGPIPKGVQTPNVGNRGTIISSSAASVRIYAFMGTGDFAYCDKFGWNGYSTQTASSTYRYCVTTIPK